MARVANGTQRAGLGILTLIGLLTLDRASLESQQPARQVVLSIVGTTDLHGFVSPVNGRGGLALFGGYLNNLRAARAADGGAVVLVDSGDTYLDGVESNVSEGAVVIDAYNALGYHAAAIGNHDFEYGAIDTWPGPDTPAADRRGALKARAAQARFPFLAANLREKGLPVDWPNVRPSTVIDAAGVTVGLIGVMTIDALSMTLAANVADLTVVDLVPVIEAEATRLRAAGADVVVVAAHAGGDCTAFERPTDLSTCDDTAEVFEVARRLPTGLVDVMMTGHTHAAVAHEVNGIAVAQAYSWGRAFSRVDLTVERGTSAPDAGRRNRVAAVRIFPPHAVCATEGPAAGCSPSASASASASASGRPARYEGRVVEADSDVEAAMAPARARVAATRATSLGFTFDRAVVRGSGREESPLGNLVADAMHAWMPGTDAAIGIAAGPGGLRADLGPGPATFGGLYDIYPFDNLVVRRTLSGGELRRILTSQFQRPRFGGRALGVAGLQVRVDCANGAPRLDVGRGTVQPLEDDDRLVVAMSDFLAARVDQVVPGSKTPHAGEPPVQMRDVVRRWLQTQPSPIRSDRFSRPEAPRWAVAPGALETCLPR